MMLQGMYCGVSSGTVGFIPHQYPHKCGLAALHRAVGAAAPLCGFDPPWLPTFAFG
jgi:hypothetical protein